MDTITLAITAALGKLNDENVRGMYTQLKDKLAADYSSQDSLLKALAGFEQNPASPEHQEALAQEMVKAGADGNPELTGLAESYLTRLKDSGVEFWGTGTVRVKTYQSWDDKESDW